LIPVKAGIVFGSLFVSLALACAFGQIAPPPAVTPQQVATVEVIAFDTRGPFLGAANVKTFESYDHHEFASSFHDGRAEKIPFGVYRVVGSRTAYYSETRYVNIFQRNVTVVLGLSFGFELPEVPLTLRGRVLGLSAPPGKDTFVKLCGVYSNESFESAIDSRDMFEFAGLRPSGVFLLLVVGKDGVLASRTITIPYVGPLLEIDVGSGDHMPH